MKNAHEGAKVLWLHIAVLPPDGIVERLSGAAVVGLGERTKGEDPLFHLVSSWAARIMFTAAIERAVKGLEWPEAMEAAAKTFEKGMRGEFARKREKLEPLFNLLELIETFTGVKPNV